MVSAIAVANFFIQKSFETGIEVTPMKLLKLVYIAHGWSLGLWGTPLINEPVEAWTYGPVIPDLYKHVKEFGRGRITKLITISEFKGLTYHTFTPTIPESDTKTRKLLNEIWEVYGDKGGLYLSAITHQDGTPWSRTKRNDIIPHELIKEHYQLLATTSA